MLACSNSPQPSSPANLALARWSITPNGIRPATAATGDAAPTWAGLEDDDTWQGKYFTAGAAQREIAFWVP